MLYAQENASDRAELQAYREASKNPVADVVAWSSPNEERTCDIRWRRHDVQPGPLYAAPPLQAVTSPDRIPRIYDEGRFRYVRDGVRFSSNYAKGWNDSISEMLKSTTNEP